MCDFTQDKLKIFDLMASMPGHSHIPGLTDGYHSIVFNYHMIGGHLDTDQWKLDNLTNVF